MLAAVDDNQAWLQGQVLAASTSHDMAACFLQHDDEMMMMMIRV